MKRRTLLSLLPAGLMPPSHAQPMPQRVVMATMFDQADNGAGTLLGLIYTEAFRQLGVELEIRLLPPTRARVEAVAGIVDGELARSYAYGVIQHTLVRVPESTLIATTSAYVRSKHIRLDGWDSLRGTTYRVEFRAGYQATEQRLASLVPAAQLSSVSGGEQGLQKLAIGRTDVYVDAEEFVEPLLATGRYAKQGVHKAAVLERTPIHAYLNKRNEALAQPLAEVLRKMKASGQIEHFRAVAAQANQAGADRTP
jgi:ABC-type amino acid transport substrate-binding protein